MRLTLEKFRLILPCFTPDITLSEQDNYAQMYILNSVARSMADKHYEMLTLSLLMHSSTILQSFDIENYELHSHFLINNLKTDKSIYSPKSFPRCLFIYFNSSYLKILYFCPSTGVKSWSLIKNVSSLQNASLTK